ncbi:MAG TPA: PD-(D/E)XK nuclease-like domain-containing protein [Nitrosomonas sp.]|nr:PD-(D/E)XK nuclease-like domain-containing protein [Nitrosomonas sp.]
MTTTLYTNKELSNERYHSEEFPQASGSVMAEIITTCPAEFIGKEREEKEVFTNGTTTHCAILEPAQFKIDYVRGIDPADYPDALDGNSSLEKWLEERGIKCKKKPKAELLELIDMTGENPPILQRIIDSHAANAAENNMQVVDPKLYDSILKMRSALKKNGYIFSPDLMYEVSIVDDEFKVRIDIIVPPGAMAPDGTITKNGEIWDYKTCASVHPEKFGTDAAKFKYWLKMALQADMFERHFGVQPDRVVLLAQGKKAPFLPVAYALDDQQLNAGRGEYWEAKVILDECKSTGNWIGYAPKGAVVPLFTPVWAAYQYGFDTESVELIEAEE